MSRAADIPNEEDLIGLPYFAILALGARCARRVAPLFRTWKRAPDEHVRAVSQAVQAVEELAGSPDSASRAPLWVSAADAALLAADAASAADEAAAPPAALLAADAAAELAGAIDPEVPRQSAARAVRKTIRASASALEHNDAGSEEPFLEELAGDLEKIRRHASAEGWTDETGVTIRDA